MDRMCEQLKWYAGLLVQNNNNVGGMTGGPADMQQQNHATGQMLNDNKQMIMNYSGM